MKALDIVHKILAETDDVNQEKIALNVLMAVSHLSYNKAKKLEMKLSNKSKVGVSSAEIISALNSFKHQHDCLRYDKPDDINVSVTTAAFALYVQGLVHFDTTDIEYGLMPTPHGVLIATQLFIEDGALSDKECALVSDFKEAEQEHLALKNN